MNTRIYYLYRDADNYKMWNGCIIEGVLTEVQKQKIRDCLLDGEYFIPCAVGLPEKSFVDLGYSYDEQADSPYFELSMDGIETTCKDPTVPINAEQLTYNFVCVKDKWEELAGKLRNSAKEEAQKNNFVKRWNLCTH